MVMGKHRCKKGRTHRLRWRSPWICRWQRNPGARGQGRVTPTIQPYNSADHLPCDAIWGGNKNAYRDIRTSGLTVSVYSSASDGAEGGDMCYVAVCKNDIVTRIALC